MTFRAASDAVQGVDLRDFVLGGVITPTVVAVAFVKGWICRGADLDRERTSRDALQKFVTEEVIPALTRATDALQDSAAEQTIRRRER